jgi:hypothetical protein
MSRKCACPLFLPLYGGGDGILSDLEKALPGILQRSAKLGDNPAVRIPQSIYPPVGGSTSIDLSYQFTDYIVWVFDDGSIYSLGKAHWQVRFVGTLQSENDSTNIQTYSFNHLKDANGNDLSVVSPAQFDGYTNNDPSYYLQAPTATDVLRFYLPNSNTSPFQPAGP